MNTRTCSPLSILSHFVALNYGPNGGNDLRSLPARTNRLTQFGPAPKVQAQHSKNTTTPQIVKQQMKNTANNQPTKWHNSLPLLNWGAKHAQRSATIALSKAQWLGIDRDVAIQAVCELCLGEFFRANPQISLQTWHSVSEQIACLDERAMLAA